MTLRITLSGVEWVRAPSEVEGLTLAGTLFAKRLWSQRGLGAIARYIT